jgi:hypothetical protein
MGKHAEGVRSQPESTLILTLTPLQMTLLRPPLRRMPALPQLMLLPTGRHSRRALELRTPLWDGNDAWLLDYVSLVDAPWWPVRRRLVGGR